MLGFVSKTFEQRRYFFLACNMYKCVNGLAPEKLLNNTEMYFDRHGFIHRNADSHPQPNMECFKQSFNYSCAHKCCYMEQVTY